MRVHVATSKECRGRYARDGSRLAFDWIFSNTPTRRIVARIQPHKRHVRHLAARSGMKYIGMSDGRAIYEVEKWVV